MIYTRDLDHFVRWKGNCVVDGGPLKIKDRQFDLWEWAMFISLGAEQFFAKQNQNISYL